MILIVGGTGALGSAATEKLLAQREAVRVMTRTPDKAQALQELGAEVVQGDLRDQPSLIRACQGVDTVLAAAHSIMGSGSEASKYIDDQGHRWLIDAAKDAGVTHFVYTSALGAAPDSPSNMQVVGMYEELAGRKAKVSHVPLGMLWIMSPVAGLFNPGLSQVMQVSILNDTTDQTFDPSGLLQRYPLTLTRLAEWIPNHVPADMIPAAG